MKHFDLLEQKRKHVRTYNKKIPSKNLIETSLYKAWKTTPSKNNAMPYKVFVWGPDKEADKEKIYNLCLKGCKDAEQRAVNDRLSTKTSSINNPNFEHIKNNPYLFTIHGRISKPNVFHKNLIDNHGMFYDQGYESHMKKIENSVAVEVGIFISNLSTYLLENELDISYNLCFKRSPSDWHKVGLNMIKTRPILMMSCGYAERYRYEDVKEWKMVGDDIKPEIKEIIEWI